MDEPRVFISYSHKNEDWKNRLIPYLEVVFSNGKNLEVWDDRKVHGGAKWEKEILGAINTCDIAILLISIEFLNSVFIKETEVPLIREREAKGELVVYPILCEECPWKTVDWLQETQMRPLDARPLAAGDDNQINTDLTKIAVEVSELFTIEKKPTRAAQPTTKKELLPYLADRVPQELKLNKILRAQSPNKTAAKLVCFIHGDEYEGIDEFIDRMKDDTLPNLLHLKDTDASPKPIFVSWPKTCTDLDDLKEKIFYNLMTHVPHDTPADDYVKIATAINKCHNGPLLIYSILLTNDSKTNCEKVISGFQEFWADWPKPPKNKLVVSCLLIKYLRDAKQTFMEKLFNADSCMKVNEDIRSYLQSLNFPEETAFQSAVLPEFESVDRTSAENWTRHKKVKKAYPDLNLIPLIQTIYTSPEEKIPMAEFATKINEKILKT